MTRFCRRWRARRALPDMAAALALEVIDGGGKCRTHVARLVLSAAQRAGAKPENEPQTQENQP